MPGAETGAADFVRTINGARYARFRGRLYRLGDDLRPGDRAGGPTVPTGAGGLAPIAADLTVDPESKIAALSEATGAREFDPHEPDPLRDEIARLEAGGFIATATAARSSAGYQDPEPLGPLDLGAVLVDVRAFGPVAYTRFSGNCLLTPKLPAFKHDDVRALLKRHANGDHGDVGKAADVVPTEDDRWAPEIAPPLVRNAMAIESGRGIVRSAYSADLKPLAVARGLVDPTWRLKSQLVALNVVTLIGQTTVAWPSWTNIGF